jgi:hypothetical protein
VRVFGDYNWWCYWLWRWWFYYWWWLLLHGQYSSDNGNIIVWCCRRCWRRCYYSRRLLHSQYSSDNRIVIWLSWRWRRYWCGLLCCHYRGNYLWYQIWWAYSSNTQTS